MSYGKPQSSQQITIRVADFVLGYQEPRLAQNSDKV